MSIDGDADRYIYYINKENHFKIINGNYFIALLVICV